MKRSKQTPNKRKEREDHMAMAQNYQPSKWMVPTKHDHFCGSFGTNFEP